MDNLWIWLMYPLVITIRLLLGMAIEIVGFPIKNGEFPIAILVYQRVPLIYYHIPYVRV